MLPVMGAVHPVGAQLQTCARRRRAAGEPRRRSPHFHEQFVPGRMQKRIRPGPSDRTSKCKPPRGGTMGRANVRYSTAAGPPPGHAATAVSVEMKIRRRAMPVGGARLQFRKLWPCGNRQASRRRAAAACRASYVTCRCAISGCCAVGASTSSGAAAATSTPASILPVRKYQTRSAIWQLC
jgi:hypothetical protein